MTIRSSFHYYTLLMDSCNHCSISRNEPPKKHVIKTFCKLDQQSLQKPIDYLSKNLQLTMRKVKYITENRVKFYNVIIFHNIQFILILFCIVVQGIPTLLMAAGSFDDILAITGFSTCLGIAFSTG